MKAESIKDFLMRIRPLAVDCEFSCPACKTDISSINIKDQLIRSLHNETLQTDILAKATQLKTIDNIVKHAEAFETALRDQSQLHSSAEVHATCASSLFNATSNNNNNAKHVAVTHMGSWTHLLTTLIAQHGGIL